MAKNDAELQALEQPKSRNEEYLNFLCGRAVDINSLPDKPYSRVEHYLEYLCHNIGQGGGGGANPLVALTNAVINNNIITFQKSDGATVQVDLNELNTRINNIVPTQGNINLELRQVGDSIRLQVEGQDAGVIDLAGFVKSVNNIAPVVGANGNITLNAEHMNYDDANTQLGVRTVQEAIEKLKEDMDLIDGAEIYIVADKNELDGLVVAGTLNKGDIIYVIDSTDVVDYDNVNVDNGNNPASMIYDDAVGGNHLRLFSKVVPTIHLDAINVSYDNQTSQLVATDVQGAIDELNGKFIEDITFDEARNRTIFKTKNNQEEAVVEGLVRVWKDLDYVEQYPYINVFDLAKRQQGKQYGNNGQVVTANQYWHIVEVDVEENTEYTLMKMHSYSNGYKVVFFNSDGTYHSEDNNNAPASNGWHRKTVRTPQGVTKVGLQLQYGATTVPRANEMMFLKGNVTENINPFIPYSDGNLIQVLKDISLEFDNSNSNLKSTTVESAIKEVNNRFTTTVKSVNEQLPNELGNVTVNASQINTLNGSSIENELSELSIRKADKYGNSFISDLTVEDIKITNRPIKESIFSGTAGLAGTKTLAGDTNAYVSQDTKISLIRVGLHGYSEGETVKGVEVYAVNKVNNTIVERIIYEGTGVARKSQNKNDNALYVDVEVNKSFSVEVYFIARLRVIDNKGMRLNGTFATGIAFDKTTNDQELQVGSGIPIGNSSTRVPNILIYSETSLSNAIVNATLNNTNGIDFTKANGTITTVNIPNAGTVTSVNGIQPVNGEVTVNAEHIGYDKTQTQIQADTVQQAIDMLKQDVDLLPTASIYIVQDKTELDDLLGRNVLNHGDLIYVINSTDVVDYAGQPANGGNPVAMIYDTLLATGNKLRVFSKFNTTVNITAKNVEYDDQTTNLQANNVQGAIEKLNEKIANAGTVKSVNGVMPQVDGDVVLRGENIDVEVLFTPGTVQTHLEEIKTLAQTAQNESQTALLRADTAFNGYNRLNPIVTNNTNEITALKRRSQYRVGDVITTFKQSNNNYTIDNVVFIYLGRANNTVSATTYPDLATAFGIQSSTANFTLPQIQDIERFFNVNQRTYQKHFIVAKIN